MTAVKNVFERYGYYLKYIRLLGHKPITETVSPSSLGMDPASTQMAYREIKDAGFQGTVIPYLAYVSTYYLFEIWASRMLNMDEKAIPVMVSHHVFQQCMADHPVDAVNALRSFPILPLRNPDPGWSESLAKLKSLDGYSAATDMIVRHLGHDANYVMEDIHASSDFDKVLLSEAPHDKFIVHYAKIQAVTSGYGSSLRMVNDNQRAQPQAATTSSHGKSEQGNADRSSLVELKPRANAKEEQDDAFCRRSRRRNVACIQPEPKKLKHVAMKMPKKSRGRDR